MKVYHHENKSIGGISLLSCVLEKHGRMLCDTVLVRIEIHGKCKNTGRRTVANKVKSCVSICMHDVCIKIVGRVLFIFSFFGKFGCIRMREN
jgi:hypothetical protein